MSPATPGSPALTCARRYRQLSVLKLVVMQLSAHPRLITPAYPFATFHCQPQEHGSARRPSVPPLYRAVPERRQSRTAGSAVCQRPPAALGPALGTGPRDLTGPGAEQLRRQRWGSQPRVGARSRGLSPAPGPAPSPARRQQRPLRPCPSTASPVSRGAARASARQGPAGRTRASRPGAGAAAGRSGAGPPESRAGPAAAGPELTVLQPAPRGPGAAFLSGHAPRRSPLRTEPIRARAGAAGSGAAGCGRRCGGSAGRHGRSGRSAPPRRPRGLAVSARALRRPRGAGAAAPPSPAPRGRLTSAPAAGRCSRRGRGLTCSA